MREIKFRVWNKQSKKMVYYNEDCSAPDMTLNGVLLHHGTGTNLSYMYELEQFTGLHDKNGKEIYAHSLIKVVDEIREVIWHFNRWVMKNVKTGRIQEFRQIDQNFYECIGNIHAPLDKEETKREKQVRRKEYK